ncbi:DUF2264 domain-containing protein [Vibrio breoganii]
MLYLDGYRSGRGAYMDNIESMSRMCVFLSVFLSNDDFEISNKERNYIIVVLRNYFVNSFDTNNKFGLGSVGDYDQRSVELADYALALWLSRDTIWNSLNAKDKALILDNLKSVNYVRYIDNNWNLFVLLINEVIDTLSTDEHYFDLQPYEKVQNFCNEDGWFRDQGDRMSA